MIRFYATGLAILIAMASSGAALAHAALRHASPGAGSTVSESPHEVTLIFTDTLEAAFSSADVTLVNGNMIRIGVKTLSPGSYRVHWRVVSVDTHRSEGSFTFSVRGQ